VKIVQIRLEGDDAAVAAVRTRIAAVLDIEVRRTKPRRDRATCAAFIHQYLAVAVDPDADSQSSKE
jgi:hypothetical protein